MNITQAIGSPGQGYYSNNNTYQADGAGLIIGGSNAQGSFVGIQGGDVVNLINNGALPAQRRNDVFNLGIVAAALATYVVASVAMSNGALTIVKSPDVPRQLAFVVNTGATITAGALTLVYTTNTGVPQTDTLSLIAAGSVAVTLTSSKGCARLTSATVSGLVGGTSPNIQGGINAVLALPVDGNVAGLTVTAATVDAVSDVLPAQSGTDKSLITPNTAPNGTHTYTFGATYFST